MILAILAGSPTIPFPIISTCRRFFAFIDGAQICFPLSIFLPPYRSPMSFKICSLSPVSGSLFSFTQSNIT